MLHIRVAYIRITSYVLTVLAVLADRLIQRLDILPQYLEMSKVTGVTMNDLNTRGQQIKVFTQIVREARLSDFVLPDMRGGPSGAGAGNDVQYTGENSQKSAVH